MMTYPLLRAQRVICAALLLATLYCLGAASWIHVKAELAQWLIQHAWQQALKGSQSLHIKPWPWADTEPVAQLTLANGEQWVVLRGAQGNSLAFGPGLVEGSALPGEGFSVVGGHRDTHFASLANTMAGDRIFVHTRNGTAIEYEVQFAGVVDIRQQPLQLENTHRLLLVTCFPFDGVQSDAHKRWLVRAAPIKSDSEFET
ncbi:class GN sortase [Simiduia aestuariiviva]|uniref:Sortase A n=1 Tax=Simiduia aestuariiviva TaxID=1510459 RepID=A0A839UME8_9GAMM|nr:class GN sortase [Simiduia aestuariiviva]MBB3168883.1 sortase A [Simiduia aestuariiviva]